MLTSCAHANYFKFEIVLFFLSAFFLWQRCCNQVYIKLFKIRTFNALKSSCSICLHLRLKMKLNEHVSRKKILNKIRFWMKFKEKSAND